MKSNIFKKIITLSFITIFVFSFFVSFSVAQTKEKPLVIKADLANKIVGDPIKITATLFTKTGGEFVMFTASQTTLTKFTPGNQCQIPKITGNSDFVLKECSVTLTTSASSIKIDASAWDLEGTVGVADSLNLNIPKTKTAPTPAPTPEKVNTDTMYKSLAPLPDLGLGKDGNPDGSSFDTAQNCAFGVYLRIIIKLVLGIAAVLAMIMITVGGIEYLTSELVASKEAGKGTITNAILGLVIALGAFLILNTVNPDLLNVCLKLPDATIVIDDLGSESSEPFVPISKNSLEKSPFNIPCSGNDGNGNSGKAAVPGIAKAFVGKTLYSQDKRNTTTSSKIYVDCSSFAAQVYVCAGLPKPGNRSTDIFSNANAKSFPGSTADFTKLNPGDLIGWKPGDNGDKNGHVMIYLGNNLMIDTQGGKGRTDSAYSTKIRELSPNLKKRITFVTWPS